MVLWKKNLSIESKLPNNKVVRFILSRWPRDSVSGSILNYLNMLGVELELLNEDRLNDAFDIYHGNAPAFLNDHLYWITI